jgi:hypothetical protein
MKSEEETRSYNNVAKSTTRNYRHHQFLHRSKLRKKKALLSSSKSHSNEDYKNQDEDKNMEIQHATQDVKSVIIILFVSLLLVSSLSESRDEIPFKGGRFVTP